ncbi:MAG: class I SAM-dependent methyltransferase [Candidatus Zixiibacteriota bacterium]
MTKDIHQDFFDKLASEWDLHYTAEDLERLSHLVDDLGIEGGMDILDMGCATGVLFDLLRRKVGPGGQVIGIDFSINMARKAHHNFPFPNVNVVDANAIDLPFAESVFDMAVAFSSFPHFSNKMKALEETRRVLKPGAMFYIIHLVSSKLVSEAHRKTGGPLTNDELPAPQELVSLFRSCGYKDIEIEEHPNLFLASAKVVK